jgi:aspartyl/glutamyl-tRNA(Asn/Gln) amidotransferase C subunit
MARMEKKDIEHLAKLARIELNDKEAEALSLDISNILGYVSVVSDLASASSGEKRVGPLHNVFREDGEPHEGGLYTEKLLNEAPERDGQYVKVKKILGES